MVSSTARIYAEGSSIQKIRTISGNERVGSRDNKWTCSVLEIIFEFEYLIWQRRNMFPLLLHASSVSNQVWFVWVHIFSIPENWTSHRLLKEMFIWRGEVKFLRTDKTKIEQWKWQDDLASSVKWKPDMKKYGESPESSSSDSFVNISKPLFRNN